MSSGRASCVRRMMPAAAWGLLAAGCAAPPRAPVEGPFLVRPTTFAGGPGPGAVEVRQADCPVPAPEGPLTLDRLLDLAVQGHPDLAVARARAEAARGKLLQAGLYPNPTVGWSADDMGTEGRGAAAGKQGPFIEQRIVTGGKLTLAQEAAAHGVTAADWHAITRWHDAVARVRVAWFELLAAQAERRQSQENLRLAEEGLEVSKKLQAAGTGALPDVLRAQTELEQSRLRLTASEQRLDTAWRGLATAVGAPQLPQSPIDQQLDLNVPPFSWQPLVEHVLARSSEVQEARALVLQAEAQLAQAEAEPIPDLHVRVNPFYSFPERNTEVHLEVGAELPLFNRNQGNIRAAQAALAQAHQEVRQAELKLVDRLAAAYQRYEVARRQAEGYSQKIIPNATESLRLVRLGYERGDAKFDYVAVLEAQRTLVQARLAYIQALGELWRSVAEIEGLLQQPSGVACPPPELR